LFHYHAKGLRLSHHDLYLDADRIVPFSFVSHAHSDHLRNHQKILATPATIQFFNLRHEQKVRKAATLSLDFFQTLELDDFKITLYPAGHILGSAMILIEQHDCRLLYTGDFKLQPGLTAEPIQIPPADILIMESTYGHPDYCFHSQRPQIPFALAEWIDTTRHCGSLPVILAYSLGKAQEAMKMLGEMGFHVLVHSTIWRIAEIYNRFSITFPNCEILQNEVNPSEDVLILPPQLAPTIALPDLQNYRTLFLSGWAASHQQRGWQHYDGALPLSDHADFEELLLFAEAVHPQQIYLLHGFPEFADHLKRAGFQSEFLQKSE